MCGVNVFKIFFEDPAGSGLYFKNQLWTLIVNNCELQRR